MLLLEDATVEAGGRRILDGVRLAVRRGERFGIVAPSAAERDAIVGLLTGRREPTAGRVRVDGLDPVRDAALLAGRVVEDVRMPEQTSVLLVRPPTTSPSHVAGEHRPQPAAGKGHGQPHPTVLLLCADIAAASQSCERVAVLEHGRVVATFETDIADTTDIPDTADTHDTHDTVRPTSTRSTS